MNNQNENIASQTFSSIDEKNKSKPFVNNCEDYLSLIVLFSLIAQVFLLITFLIGITQYHGERASFLTFLEFLFNIVNVTSNTAYTYVSNFIIGLVYVYIVIKLIKNTIESLICSTNIYEKDAVKLRVIENTRKLINRCGSSLGLCINFIILSYCIYYFKFSTLMYLTVFIGIAFCITIKIFNKYYTREKESRFMIIVDIARNIFLSIIIILIIKLSLSQVVRDTLDGFSFLRFNEFKFANTKSTIYSFYHYGIEKILKILLTIACMKATIHILSATTYGKYNEAKKQLGFIFLYSLILTIGFSILKPFFASSLGENIEFSKEFFINCFHMIKYNYLPIILLSISGLFATSIL
jgi:hypothetical protein